MAFEVNNKNKEDTIEWINKNVASTYKDGILENMSDKNFYNFYKFELKDNPKFHSEVWVFSDQVKTKSIPKGKLMSIQSDGIEYSLKEISEKTELEYGKATFKFTKAYLLGRDESKIKLQKVGHDYIISQEEIIPGTCTEDFSETQAIINIDRKEEYIHTGKNNTEAIIELLDLGKIPLKLHYVPTSLV